MNSAANRVKRFDVVVAGAGPAGLAAAYAASQAGRSVCIVDDNPGPGGQIWRGLQPAGDDHGHPLTGPAQEWSRRFSNARVERMFGAKIFAEPEPHVLALPSSTLDDRALHASGDGLRAVALTNDPSLQFFTVGP